MSDVFDFGHDAPSAEVAPVEKLQELSTLIERMRRLRVEVTLAGATVSRMQDALDDLVERQVPELMDACNCSEHVLSDGTRVTLEDKLSHSLPKKDAVRKAAALQWLRENNQGGAIKNQVITEFGLKDDAKAAALLASLEERGLTASREENVHASTLKKILRTLMKDGVNVPQKLFGIRRYRQAKLS